MIYSTLQTQLTLARGLAVADRVVDVEQSQLAILDSQGVILAINSEWRRFAIEQGYADSQFGIGENYLDVCDRACDAGLEIGRTVAELIRDVLFQRRFHVSVRYQADDCLPIVEYDLHLLPFHEDLETRVAVAHCMVIHD